MSVSATIGATILSYSVKILAEKAIFEVEKQEADVSHERFIEDIRHAAEETAKNYDGITDELLVLTLESEQVRNSAEEFLDQGATSGEELREALELKLTEVIDSELEINVESLTDDFIEQIQKEIIEDPESWEELMSLYGDEISENIPDYQREIHKNLFNKIEKLQRNNSKLEEKAQKRFVINVILGIISLFLALFSAYLSYVTFS